MGDKKYDRKIMFAVRLVLLIIGFLLGASCAGVLFKYNPDVARDSMKIVFMVCTGLVLGLALLLTARPIVALVLALVSRLKAFFAARRPIQIVGYALGTSLGLMVAFVVFVLLSALVPFVALNIVLTLITAVAAIFSGAALCSKWLTAQEDEEPQPVRENDCTGYLLTSGALKSPKALTVAADWLSGKAVVLSATVEELLSQMDGEEGAAEALKTYKKLKESGSIKAVGYDKSGNERDDVIKYASSRRLAVVTADENERSLYEGECPKALSLNSL